MLNENEKVEFYERKYNICLLIKKTLKRYININMICLVLER